MRPVTIPHHAGRKRMHLELKDTVTKLMTGDIKKKLMDSVWSSLSALYNTATGNYEAEVKEAVQAKLDEEDLEDANNPTILDSLLNDGSRIDYVLQEAPYETFNEYVFALGSHLCYWDSEDTCLMILKDIYGILGVNPDDHMENEPANKNPNPFPNFVDDAPTAILRPPPTPMGAPMPTPTPVASTLVPPGSVTLASTQVPTVAASSSFPPSPLVMPPTPGPPSSTPLGPPVGPPAVQSLGPPNSTPIGPPSALAPPSAISGPPSSSTFPSSPLMAPIAGPPSASPTPLGGPPPSVIPSSASAPPMGPPPSMMSPSSFSAMPSSLSRPRMPRRAAYPIQANQTPIGMDPTAPTSNTNLGPPPTTGFMR